jgi:hypothetical protein
MCWQHVLAACSGHATVTTNGFNLVSEMHCFLCTRALPKLACTPCAHVRSGMAPLHGMCLATAHNSWCGSQRGVFDLAVGYAADAPHVGWCYCHALLVQCALGVRAASGVLAKVNNSSDTVMTASIFRHCVAVRCNVTEYKLAPQHAEVSRGFYQHLHTPLTLSGNQWDITLPWKEQAACVQGQQSLQTAEVSGSKPGCCVFVLDLASTRKHTPAQPLPATALNHSHQHMQTAQTSTNTAANAQPYQHSAVLMASHAV